MSKFEELKQQLDDLGNQVAHNGGQVAQAIFQAHLLTQHRGLVNQALANLKSGTLPSAVLAELKKGAQQLKAQAKTQDKRMQGYLEQNLARLATDEAFN